MGKIDLWTQTILSVDTLGLVLRVFVTAANVGERGGKRYSNESTRWATALVCTRFGSMVGLTVSHSWWVMDVCRWIVQVVYEKQTKGFVLLKKRWVVERTFGWMMSTDW